LPIKSYFTKYFFATDSFLFVALYRRI